VVSSYADGKESKSYRSIFFDFDSVDPESGKAEELGSQGEEVEFEFHPISSSPGSGMHTRKRTNVIATNAWSTLVRVLIMAISNE